MGHEKISKFFHENLMALACRATHDVIYDVAIFFYKEEHDKTETVKYVLIIGAKLPVFRFVQLTVALHPI